MGRKKHPGDVVDSCFKDLIWGGCVWPNQTVGVTIVVFFSDLQSLFGSLDPYQIGFHYRYGIEIFTNQDGQWGLWKKWVSLVAMPWQRTCKCQKPSISMPPRLSLMVIAQCLDIKSMANTTSIQKKLALIKSNQIHISTMAKIRKYWNMAFQNIFFLRYCIPHLPRKMFVNLDFRGTYPCSDIAAHTARLPWPIVVPSPKWPQPPGWFDSPHDMSVS